MNWGDWEDSHIAVRYDHQLDPRYADEAFLARSARLPGTHYWRQAARQQGGTLLREAAMPTGSRPCNGCGGPIRQTPKGHRSSLAALPFQKQAVGR
ncbi:hypothetical protein [Streptomyces sp. NPDC047043]|uniref:hypothetical protein n=1 Tax=Streptomyces sp. NPDC047043 TaxID=3154497 RepID=UPI0033EC0114